MAASLTASMRAVVTRPEQISSALYRRFWRRVQLEACLPDLTVRGEPYLSLNGLVLEQDDHLLLTRLTAIFSQVFQKAGQRVAGDVPMTVSLGFPWAAAELLANECQRLPIVGRFDFVQDLEGQWRLLEQNADTPSGIREGIVCDQLVHEMLPEASQLVRPSTILGERLTAAVVRAVLQGISEVRPGGAKTGHALGLVTTASELEDLAQMAYTAELLRPALAAHGIDVVLGDAGNLRLTGAGLTLRGQRIDTLYRYLPYESIFGTQTFAAMEEAAALGQVVVLNGLYGLLLQNKGLLAWIWAHRDDADVFDVEERAAICEHLPATWTIDAAPTTVPREELVAKQVFGREGEEIYFGEDCSAELWQTLVQRQSYVAQQRVQVAQTAAVVQSSTGPELWNGRATVGGFAVDGQFAGYYTRYGGKITTGSSKWLATFVAQPGAGD